MRIISDNDGALGFSQLARALGEQDMSLLPVIKELLAKGLIREEKSAACRFTYFICPTGQDELERLAYIAPSEFG